jgi:plastocyanin
MSALVDGTEYWFAVTAVDSAGNESKVGTSVSATPTNIEVTPPGPIPTVFTIVIDAGFQPATATVFMGTTVVWTNLDGDLHTVTSDSNIFNSGSMLLGDTFSYTFTQVAIWYYHCEPHFWHTGVVIVRQIL